MLELSKIYEQGLGVKQDLQKSVLWLNKAKNVPKSYETEYVAGGTKSHRRLAKISLENIKKKINKNNLRKNKIDKPMHPSVDFGTYYALVIGNDNYQHLETKHSYQ